MENMATGSAIAEPGKVGTGYLSTGSYNDGAPVESPVIILHGSKPGPRLWLQACMHGNEYCGALAILQVCREVDPQEMSGTLFCFPAINITAFRAAQRFSPYSLYGMPDLNRVFPGNKEGNFAEIMARNLFQTFTQHAEYMIDFHCGHNAETFWTLYGEDGSETAKRSNELARAFGFDLIYPCTSEILESALFTQATRNGIPSVIVEAGGSGPLATSKAVSAAVEGILNVMKYLKILDEPFSFADSYVMFKDWKWLMSPHGGRFVPTVGVRERIKKSQVLARVFTVFNEELEPVKSPVDGIILTFSRKPFVAAGESIFQIGIP